MVVGWGWVSGMVLHYILTPLDKFEILCNKKFRKFPGGPVVRTLHSSTAGGPGLIPDPGTKVL